MMNQPALGEDRRTMAAWWLLGLLNNACACEGGARARPGIRSGRKRTCKLCSPPPSPLPPAAAPACRLLNALAPSPPPCSPLFSSPIRTAYVIMLAGANSISAAAVGLVYLAAVGPSLLCKASAPYWFHAVRYTPRMHAAAALMSGSYTVVALSSGRGWQLLGVVLASLQGGLGEASCLAMTSYYQ